VRALEKVALTCNCAALRRCAIPSRPWTTILRGFIRRLSEGWPGPSADNKPGAKLPVCRVGYGKGRRLISALRSSDHLLIGHTEHVAVDMNRRPTSVRYHDPSVLIQIHHEAALHPPDNCQPEESLSNESL